MCAPGERLRLLGGESFSQRDPLNRCLETGGCMAHTTDHSSTVRFLGGRTKRRREPQEGVTLAGGFQPRRKRRYQFEDDASGGVVER